jgi:signal transduction histidine kinase
MRWLRRRLPFNRLWFQFAMAIAIVVIVAALLLAAVAFSRRPDPPPPPAQALLDRADFPARLGAAVLESALTLIFVGSILGIAAGAWLSRRMTAPLDDLAAGAEQVGAGDLTVRVTPKGSDEMIALADAFNRMAAALRQAEQLRQHMLADVAHELRTPLTVLQGNLRAILDDVYPLDKAEIASLYDQTRHLHRLVNDLHELAQAEAGQLPLTLRAVDVAGLVQDVAELFAPLAEAQNVALTCTQPGRPLLVQADPARLMQVLQNLLTNALRHTPAGGAITVTARTAGAQVEIAVADSGEGISTAHLAHVFDRFYRTDAARDRDAGGAGLGLAIVRALVETHGGAVRVASAGQGSTFVVALPGVQIDN